MADFPETIYDQRPLANLPGITYDPTETKNLFAEDMVQLGDEVTAIETELGLNPKGTFPSVESRLISLSGSAGFISLPSFVTEADGSVTVGSADILLFNNALNEGVCEAFTVAGGNFMPTNNVSSVLAIDYNAGAPSFRIQAQGITNFSDNIALCTIFRAGTDTSSLFWGSTASGLSNKILERLIHTSRFALQSGLALGEVATRVVTVTAGVTWNGVNEINLLLANSSACPTTLWKHVTGVYTAQSITQYNNTQYDNGTDLVTLTTNRYAVNWVYRQEQSDARLHILLGTGDYTINQALSAQPPASLPDSIRTNTILVGRIIVQKSVDVATEINSAFVYTFTPSLVKNHNDLANIQGGTNEEYYHLTSEEYSLKTKALFVQTYGSTTTFNIDTNGGLQIVTMTGNPSLAVTVSLNRVFSITLKQDSTGSRTVTWFSGISWSGGAAPTLTIAPNKSDTFIFIRTATGAYLGFIVGQNN